MQDIKIDFQVLDTYDPFTFSVADYSNWAHIVDKPAIIEITLPGCSDVVTHYFQKGSINIFNSLNLGLNCSDCGDELVELDDGIYELTLKGSPDSFNKTRKFLRTVCTELELDKLFINTNLLCDNNSGLIEKLFEIKFYLEAAKSNVRYDNICQSQELLFKAQEMIEKLSHKCK